jgi:hypothetical protein
MLSANMWLAAWRRRKLEKWQYQWQWRRNVTAKWREIMAGERKSS